MKKNPYWIATCMSILAAAVGYWLLYNNGFIRAIEVPSTLAGD